MDHAERMRDYLAQVERFTRKLESLAPVIAREVESQFGHKLLRAKSQQERDNLRKFYTIQVGRENVWKQSYISDRDLYIRLATMHGIAALVEQTSATTVTEVL